MLTVQNFAFPSGGEEEMKERERFEAFLGGNIQPSFVEFPLCCLIV
jgi:hypothetical protein